MAGRAAAHATPFGRGGAATLALLVSAVLAAALFPWFPGGPGLEVGSSAPRTIRAPRDRTYESTVRTEERREQAAAAVPDVLVFDPGRRERQLAELERQLSAIDTVRRDGALSDSAKETTIRAVEGVSLSQRAASVLASTGDGEWDALTEELRSALGRTLAVALNENELAEARQHVRELFSSLLSSEQALALGELADELVMATQVVDERRTEERREQARFEQPVVTVTVVQGQTVVAAGELLDAANVEQLDVLGLRGVGVELSRVAAATVLALMAGAACGGYLLVAQPRALRSLRRRLLFALLLVVPALAVKVALPVGAPGPRATVSRLRAADRGRADRCRGAAGRDRRTAAGAAIGRGRGVRLAVRAGREQQRRRRRDRGFANVAGRRRWLARRRVRGGAGRPPAALSAGWYRGCVRRGRRADRLLAARCRPRRRGAALDRRGVGRRRAGSGADRGRCVRAAQSPVRNHSRAWS